MTATRRATREELYAQIEKGARIDSVTFCSATFLSTVVAAIGLIGDNVAVVVGAMVIAPLLGPNIAAGLRFVAGDGDLVWKALRAALTGLGPAFAVDGHRPAVAGGCRAWGHAAREQ